MEITDYIKTKVTYDKHGQYIWTHEPDGEGMYMVAEVRGWASICNMFRVKHSLKDGVIDMEAANEFQDRLGEFIATAINEKLERDKP
jgi:hypothetical protein